MNTFNLINDGGQLYSFLVIPVHWLKMKYQYFFENSINFFRVEKKYVHHFLQQSVQYVFCIKSGGMIHTETFKQHQMQDLWE